MDSEIDWAELIGRKLKIPSKHVTGWNIIRRAVDARRKPLIYFVYTVETVLNEVPEPVLRRMLKDNDVKTVEDAALPVLNPGGIMLESPPVVIGTGPAGLFAALTLAQYGYRPLVFERGNDVDRRTADVKRFWQDGELAPESNVQFGEGGAGTFSDGKLTTRVNDPRINYILQQMVTAGAPPEILYEAKPHVGTDRLRGMVKSLRQRIIAAGGEVRFGTKVTDLIMEHGRVTGVVVNEREVIRTSIVVLAIGHSARDTYEMLWNRGVDMAAKALAIGARVEHPQPLIDYAQYGEMAGYQLLGAADYALVTHPQETSRAVYSFCMCPGGTVVGAASEPATVVTNGMSEYARDTGIANSALVVTVDPADFPGDTPLSGIKFQRKWERAAYQVGGSNYHAPVQRVTDFLAERPSNELPVAKMPSYRPGVTPTDLHLCLPETVSKSLRSAILDFDRKISGFAGETAVLTGVETRTSAPVRINRNEQLESVSHPGLYPAGEGAGYAGGIISAAIDGIKVAEKIIQRYARP